MPPRRGRSLQTSTAAFALLLLLLGACRSGDGTTPSVDRRPRVPDDAGVVTAVSTRDITLDGAQSYPLARTLQSFSMYDRRPAPVRAREGQYVHVGIVDGEVVWVEGIGAVLPGDPPLVYVTGEVVALPAGRVRFEGGTVFRVAVAVVAPEPGRRVRAAIDPRSDSIVRFDPL